VRFVSITTNQESLPSDILTLIVSVFVNITSFRFLGLGKDRIVINEDSGFSDIDIDHDELSMMLNWNAIFAAMFRAKEKCLVSNGFVNALESIQCRQMSQDQSIAMMDALRHNEHQRHYNLRKFELEIVFCTGLSSKSSRRDFPAFPHFDHYHPLPDKDLVEYKNFMKRFIRFINSNKNKETLRVIALEYGNRMEVFSEYKQSFESVNYGVDWLGDFETEQWFDVELGLLANLPRGIRFLTLKQPLKQYIGKSRMTDGTRKQFINALCNMLLNKDHHSLQEITFKGLDISAKERNYLMLMFGFNCNLCVEEKNYSFLFNNC